MTVQTNYTKKPNKTKEKPTKERKKMKNEWKCIEERRIYMNVSIEETYWKDQVSVYTVKWSGKRNHPPLRNPTSGDEKSKKEEKKKMRNKYNVLWKHQKRIRDGSVKRGSCMTKSRSIFFALGFLS